MVDSDPRSSDGAAVNSECAAANANAHQAVPAAGNHAPAKAEAGPVPSLPAPKGAPDDRSGLDRAEELVDSLADKVSSLTASWGRKLLRLSSRARESVQDFWSEVQDFRQGKEP
jgi:hypothetical protein